MDLFNIAITKLAIYNGHDPEYINHTYNLSCLALLCS